MGMALALVAGGVVGYISAGYQYSAQLNKVKSMFPATTAISFVSGTVKSVSGNVITMQTPSSGNPFEDLPTVRQVTVTSGTKIVRNEPKDPKVYQKEVAAYQAAVQKMKPIQTAATTPAMPQPFTETALKISDLKAGDVLMVDAGKDIKTRTSFDAVKITVGGSGTAGVPGGVAPIVNIPQVRTDGGVPPIVNVPAPIKK